MQKITPFLWFDNNAEEAMNFYTSVFKEAKITNKTPGPDGKIMSGSFELFGQEFMVLNGGPLFKFNESVSFFVTCEDQAEVDYYWDKLLEGGEPSQCGWLKDKYGLSWQIIPKALGEYLGNEDQEKAGRAMQAMLQMTKIDVAKLKAAFDGE
jgi:predicted 3-demethylubiquinone-9 3-methyltransferase (glyoxalase superfamily)